MYRLPENLRKVLAEPFGPVHTTGETIRKVKGRMVVSVGDVVTQMFLDRGVLPKIMVIDGVTLRGSRVSEALTNLPTHGVRTIKVDNPPATITRPLIGAMDRGFKESGSTLIRVSGEEDLAALPAMILAPEGAAVCYGQPREGVVVVVVTPVVRQRAKDILQQMDVS